MSRPGEQQQVNISRLDESTMPSIPESPLLDLAYDLQGCQYLEGPSGGLHHSHIAIRPTVVDIVSFVGTE